MCSVVANIAVTVALLETVLSRIVVLVTIVSGFHDWEVMGCEYCERAL